MEAAETLLNEIDGQGTVLQADLYNADEVTKLFERATKAEGLRAIVNNAGVAISSDPDKPIEAFVDDWDRTMEINLRATGQLCNLAIKHFKRQGGGRILNITSRAAFRGDTKDYLAYAASKAGVVALTRSIARAYGKENIVAFNIAPGFTKTDMAQDFIDQYGEDIVLNDIALNTLTKPEDIAPMAAFLLSGLADHSTGGTFDINAGSYVH